MRKPEYMECHDDWRDDDGEPVLIKIKRPYFPDEENWDEEGYDEWWLH